MTGIYPGAGLTVAGTTTCTFATATRASNIVTAQFSSSCHIPAGVNVTIAGGSDTSFDGTFAVAQSDGIDYRNHFINGNRNICPCSQFG
jgi:hypothetical protein